MIPVTQQLDLVLMEKSLNRVIYTGPWNTLGFKPTFLPSFYRWAWVQIEVGSNGLLEEPVTIK